MRPLLFAALLQRDGEIVGTDGSSPVQFTTAVKDYHIAVRHRNHLGVMTAAPRRVSVATKSYDLKDGSVPLYGSEPTFELGGVDLLWTGNVLPDDRITYTGVDNDRDPILVRIGGTVATNVVTGYFPEDVNLDGRISYTGSRNDRDRILTNIGGLVPTNTRTEQLR